MKFSPKATPQQSAPSMTMIMVPEEEWRNLHDTLEQIIDLITRRNSDDYADLDAFLRSHRIGARK